MFLFIVQCTTIFISAFTSKNLNSKVMRYLYLYINVYHILFQDIIENEDIKLDDMFIASLVHDLIKVGSP